MKLRNVDEGAGNSKQTQNYLKSPIREAKLRKSPTERFRTLYRRVTEIVVGQISQIEEM